MPPTPGLFAVPYGTTPTHTQPGIAATPSVGPPIYPPGISSGVAGPSSMRVGESCYSRCLELDDPSQLEFTLIPWWRLWQCKLMIDFLRPLYPMGVTRLDLAGSTSTGTTSMDGGERKEKKRKDGHGHAGSKVPKEMTLNDRARDRDEYVGSSFSL